MVENLTNVLKKGIITVEREDTGEVLYRADNIITNISRWLFSMFMAATSPISLSPPQLEPISVAAQPPGWGVWGLALGAGLATWQGIPPTETATQVSLFQEIARVQLSRINFVDNTVNFNPQPTWTTNVDFQTTVNTQLNNINQGIKEMGLIGGGVATTNMQTAPYFNGNPSSYPTLAAAQNTVILLNYKTLPSLTLPPGVNIIFSWVFQF